MKGYSALELSNILLEGRHTVFSSGVDYGDGATPVEGAGFFLEISAANKQAKEDFGEHGVVFSHAIQVTQEPYGMELGFFNVPSATNLVTNSGLQPNTTALETA